MAAVFDKNFSVGLAAALEFVFDAALAATFDSERETALAVVLFGVLFSDLAVVVPATTFVFAFCLPAAAAPVAAFAVFTTRVSTSDLAAEGFAPFTEDNWGFADFFIAFAMESTKYGLLFLTKSHTGPEVHYILSSVIVNHITSTFVVR